MSLSFLNLWMNPYCLNKIQNWSSMERAHGYPSPGVSSTCVFTEAMPACGVVGTTCICVSPWSTASSFMPLCFSKCCSLPFLFWMHPSRSAWVLQGISYQPHKPDSFSTPLVSSAPSCCSSLHWHWLCAWPSRPFRAALCCMSCILSDIQLNISYYDSMETEGCPQMTFLP